MAQKQHPLDPVDSAWLHMDDPTNLMMVTSIALLDGPLDIERYRRTLETRVLPLGRFRQRVVESRGLLGTPHWEEDPHFTLDSHIHRVALPSPGDMESLQEFLSDLSSTPLDYSKPLWQVHLVENVLGGSAMVLRFHHCIGDGSAMNAVMARLMDTSPDAPIDAGAPNGRHPAPHGPIAALVDSVAETIDGSIRAVEQIAHEGFEILRHPEHLLGTAAGGAAALSRVLLMSPEVATPLKGGLGVQKRVAWSGKVAVEDVKQVCARSGAKINDVLLAAVAGALGRYLASRGARPDGVEIRAVVPVDLRPPERAMELGNQFGLVFLELPVGIGDADARIALVKRRMEDLKRSPEALVFLGLLNLFGRTPAQVEAQAVSLFQSKATAVMTNVRGPSQRLYLAGRRIENMMFWVPQAGRLGMGVSILSYDGYVTLGVITDAGLVPDPMAITALFEQELAAMVAAESL
jgi:WS/DGAT/MGAT family acyltransferase